MLKDKGGIPIIDKFYAVSGGIPKGEVGINDAVLSYLSQGKLKKLAFTLEDGTAVSINRITVQGDFSRGEEVLYHNKIRLETVVEKEIEPGSREEKRIEKVLESLFMEQLVEADQRLLENLGIDVTNSFYKLGMGDRRKYEQYRGALEEYVKEMECEFEVEAIVLNERG